MIKYKRSCLLYPLCGNHRYQEKLSRAQVRRKKIFYGPKSATFSSFLHLKGGFFCSKGILCRHTGSIWLDLGPIVDLLKYLGLQRVRYGAQRSSLDTQNNINLPYECQKSHLKPIFGWFWLLLGQIGPTKSALELFKMVCKGWNLVCTTVETVPFERKEAQSKLLEKFYFRAKKVLFSAVLGT